MHLAQGLEHERCERSQNGEARPRSPEHDDADPTPFQILLKAEILIGRDESFEARCFACIQERPVIEVAPAPLLRRLDQMPGQERSERARHIAIEQDPHAGAPFRPRESAMPASRALARRPHDRA
jgi:hypothetical protein